jgi:hypothetical protein
VQGAYMLRSPLISVSAWLPVLEQIRPDTVLASSRCSEVVLESIKRHCES